MVASVYRERAIELQARKKKARKEEEDVFAHTIPLLPLDRGRKKEGRKEEEKAVVEEGILNNGLLLWKTTAEGRPPPTTPPTPPQGRIEAGSSHILCSCFYGSVARIIR